MAKKKYILVSQVVKHNGILTETKVKREVTKLKKKG